MTTPASAAPTVLLDAEQIGRTLRRMAHEIVEREGESLDRLRARRHLHARRHARAAARDAARRDRRRRGAGRRARHHVLPRRHGPARRRDARPSPAGREGLVARLPARRRDRGDRRRRALHRAHRARRDRGGLRLRPPGARAARGALRPRATASSRSARTSSARTCRPRAPSACGCTSARTTPPTRSCSSGAPHDRRRCSRRRDALQPGTRHLLSSEDLDRATIERLLELAASFEAVAEREVKKLPTLRGRTVLSVFFEASTRTVVVVRARRQAALGRHDLAQGERVVGREGRDAQGHAADARRLRPRRRRHPPRAGRARRRSPRATPAPRS